MADYSLDIKGKVAVVTGAGGVLCSMFAKTLAQQGAKVALLPISPFLQLKEAVPLASMKGKAGGSPGSSVIQAGRGPGHTPFL